MHFNGIEIESLKGRSLRKDKIMDHSIEFSLEHFGDRPCGTAVKWAFAQVRASRDGFRTSSENEVIWPENAAVVLVASSRRSVPCWSYRRHGRRLRMGRQRTILHVLGGAAAS